MAFFVRTGINNITATSSSKFDSGIGGVSLDHDLNTLAALQN